MSCVIDLSGQGLTSLDSRVFFENPFLVELNLSNNEIAAVPEAISNCALLKRIDISGTQIVRPPRVLFAIPWLRAHPENIVFGEGQRCSVDLAREIVKSCRNGEQCLLNFKDLEGVTRCLAIAPDVTSLDFFTLAHPHLAHIVSYVVIVRVCGGHVLRFIPDDVPMSLYVIEGASWAFELRFLPPDISRPMIPALVQFVEAQAAFAERHDKEFSELRASVRTFMGSNVKPLMGRLHEHAVMCARHFSVNVMNKGSTQKITISVTNDAVCVAVSTKEYYVFPPRSLSLDYVNKKYLLVCGTKGLVIARESVEQLMPLFAITSVEPDMDLRLRHSFFADIALKSMATYLNAKSDEVGSRNLGLRSHQLDQELAKYRQAESMFRKRYEMVSESESPKVRSSRRRLKKKADE